MEERPELDWVRCLKDGGFSCNYQGASNYGGPYKYRGPCNHRTPQDCTSRDPYRCTLAVLMIPLQGSLYLEES